MKPKSFLDVNGTDHNQHDHIILHCFVLPFEGELVSFDLIYPFENSKVSQIRSRRAGSVFEIRIHFAGTGLRPVFALQNAFPKYLHLILNPIPYLHTIASSYFVD
jgi:hypothetical protein